MSAITGVNDWIAILESSRGATVQLSATEVTRLLFDLYSLKEVLVDKHTIAAARIELPQAFGERARVFVRFEGEEKETHLFSYYSDEISFTPTELVGLTRDQAGKLYHAKDVAYLRS